MRGIRLLFLAGLLSSAAATVVVLAADQPSTKPTTAPSTQQAAAKPINNFCAVQTDSEIDPEVTTVYNGMVIGFCCESCIKEFKADPEKYMKGLK